MIIVGKYVSEPEHSADSNRWALSFSFSFQAIINLIFIFILIALLLIAKIP